MKQRYQVRKAEETLKNLEAFLMSLPEPLEWMKKKIEEIPVQDDPDHPWFAALREMAGDELRRAEILLSRMYSMFSESFALKNYQESWKADAELFHVKQSCVQHPDQERKPAQFAGLKAARGLTVQESDWKERYQKLRKAYKDSIQKTDELLMASPQQALEEWDNMKENLQAFQQLMTRTEELFQWKKKARAVLDFQDLEQYAVQILSDPTGRQEAQSTWRYVFVDECQDISAVQNRIVELLKHPDNHLFMVGDIKQSIYRFRLADPLLFLDRMESCRQGLNQNAESICLQTNFRSRPEILETTNMVFRAVMKSSVAEINYGPEEELIPGREKGDSGPVQSVMLQKENPDTSDLEAAACFLVEEIQELLQTPYPEKHRNYQYRDCVILMPAVHTDGPILARLLEEKGIPVFFDGTGEYYQLHEIQIVRNLLEWIDDPLRDLPLLSVLQESPFSFSEEELSQIRLKKSGKDVPFHQAFAACAEESRTELGEKCRQVQKTLKEWQDRAETMRVGQLIWDLYRDTGIIIFWELTPRAR